jgi:hypothetical protein
VNEKIVQIIPILEDLRGSCDYAEPLLSVLQSWNITEERLDALIALLSHSLNTLGKKEYEWKSFFFQEIIYESKQRELLEKQKEQRQEENILATML